MRIMGVFASMIFLENLSIALTSPLPLASYQYVSVQPISPVIHGNMMGREKRIVLVIKKM